MESTAAKCPGLLRSRVETLEPKVQWFMEELKWTEAQVKKAVKTFPPLLGLDVEVSSITAVLWQFVILALDGGRLMLHQNILLNQMLIDLPSSKHPSDMYGYFMPRKGR